MTDTAYVVAFDGTRWSTTDPDGNVTRQSTLQAAVEGAKWAAVRDGADVIWHDRQGDVQGHWKGWRR